jgi:hypothetical protein
MPVFLQPEEKANLLRAKGYDPAQYDVNEFGIISQKPQQTVINQQPPSGFSPTVNPPTTDKVSRTQALVSGAGSSAGSTVGGLGLPALAMGLGVFSGVGTVPSLLGLTALGIGGSYLGGKAQQGIESAVLPQPAFESLQQSRAVAQAEHPYAFGAGAVLPSGFALRPSVSMLRDAGKALVGARPIGSLAMRDLPLIQQQALANTAIGGALGAGIPTAQSLIQRGELPPLSELIPSTAAGLLLNTPTKLVGQKILRFPAPANREIDSVTAAKYQKRVDYFKGMGLGDEEAAALALKEAELLRAKESADLETKKYGDEYRRLQEGQTEAERFAQEQQERELVTFREQLRERQKLARIPVEDQPTQGPAFTAKDSEGNYIWDKKSFGQAVKKAVATGRFPESLLKKYRIESGDPRSVDTSIKLNESQLREFMDKEFNPAIGEAMGIEQDILKQQKAAADVERQQADVKKARVDAANLLKQQAAYNERYRLYTELKKNNVPEEKIKDFAGPDYRDFSSKWNRERVSATVKAAPGLDTAGREGELASGLEGGLDVRDIQQQIAEEVKPKIEPFKPTEPAAPTYPKPAEDIDLRQLQATMKRNQLGEPPAEGTTRYAPDEESTPTSPKLPSPPEEPSPEALKIAGRAGLTDIVGREELTGDKGEPVFGKWQPKKPQEAEVSQQAPDPDSIAIHEANHRLRMNDYAGMTKTGKALWERGEALGNDAAKALGISPEELLVRAITPRTKELARMRLSRERGNQLKTWWRDFMSNVRYTLGKDTADDIANILSRRQLDQINYWESPLAGKDILTMVKGIPGYGQGDTRLAPEKDKFGYVDMDIPAAKAIAEKVGLRWDGEQGWYGENDQVEGIWGFTDTNPKSPAYKATFYTKAGASEGEVRAKFEEKVGQFKSGGEGETRYAPATDTGESPASAKLPSRPDPFHHLLMPVNEKVKLIGGSSAGLLSKQLKAFEGGSKYYRGQFVSKLQNISEEFKPAVQDSVNSKLIEADIAGAEQGYTPEEQQLVSSLRQELVGIHDLQRKLDYKIGGIRNPKDNPTYWPSVLSKESLDILTNRPLSQEAKDIKNTIADYYVQASGGKIQKPEALDIFQEYLNALQGIRRAGIDRIKFGALNKAEGLGLPASVREKSLLETIRRYGQRAARDMAFFQYLQSNPAIRKILNIDDLEGKRFGPSEEVKIPGTEENAETLISDDRVKRALQYVYEPGGNILEVPPWLRQTMRIVSNSIFGAGTGVRDTISSVAQMMPYIRMQDYGTYFNALGKVAGNYGKLKQTVENLGLLRKDQQSMYFGEDEFMKLTDRYARNASKLADTLYKYSGRQKLEEFNRIYTYAIGEDLAIKNFLRAKSGDKQAQKMLQEFGDIVEGGVEQYWTEPGKDIPEDAIQKVATRFTDRVQQEYNPNDLPAWAISGPIAPYFTVARWSIGKANNIYRDVFVPAKNGDFAPLLAYTLGSFMTGAAIQQINKFLNAKKDYNPTVVEAFSEQGTDIQEQVNSILNLASLGSYAGITSDMAKMLGDAMSGRMPRGYNIPVINTLTDTIMGNLINAKQAIEEGAPPVETMLSFVEDVLVNTVQDVRMVANRTWKAEEVEKKEKFRDLATYEKITGRNTPELRPSMPNRYLRPEERAFKEEKNPQVAGQMAGDLVRKLVAEATDKATGRVDVEKLQSGLSRVKRMNYQTFPAPETNPQKFMGYKRFLEETQGPGEAQGRMTDFLKTREINRAKSLMIPNL